MTLKIIGGKSETNLEKRDLFLQITSKKKMDWDYKITIGKLNATLKSTSYRERESRNAIGDISFCLVSFLVFSRPN